MYITQCPFCRQDTAGNHEYNCPNYVRTSKPVITYTHEKIPYRCPVCGGKGELPSGFYQTKKYYSTANTSPEPCRTCNGTGIIWG